MDNVFRNKVERQPKYLYKYFNNLEFAKNVLENNQIHIEIPSLYNDVFDSCLTIDKNKLKNIIFNESILDRLKILDNDNVIQYLSDNDFDKLKNKKLDDVFKTLKQMSIPNEKIENLQYHFCCGLQNIKADNNKISCFSEIWDSNLMWAHYGNHLYGVCLRFDLDLDSFLAKNIHRVDYRRYRNRDMQNNFNFYFEKSLDWSYEQEWRLVVDSKEEFLNTNSCCGIVFGEHCVKNKSKEYLDLAKWAYDKGLDIFVAKANSEEYKIDIVMVKP